jgi:hypothetical protein
MAWRLFAAVVAAAVLVGLGLAGSTGTVSAHEHRAVGNYEFVVGWLNEPTLANEPNGLSLRITFFENGVPEEESEEAEAEGVPVEGAEESVQAEVIVGGGAETRELELEPAFNDPGHYEGRVIPTLAGEYTFHISGEIDGFEFDETFNSSPDTFSSVDDPAELQFPAVTAAAGNGSSSSSDDDGNADTALLIAIVAIAAALIAGAIAVYGVSRGRP